MSSIVPPRENRGTSPSNAADRREDDGWSGEEEDQEEEQQDVGDGSRKRKRPMSVSCEMCKTRKVRAVQCLPLREMKVPK